jgi:hypothetical protein
MKTIYIKHIIKSADDLPKKEGRYFIIHKFSLEKESRYWDGVIESQKKFWVDSYDSWLEEREVPEWDNIDADFHNWEIRDPSRRHILGWFKSKLNIF